MGNDTKGASLDTLSQYLQTFLNTLGSFVMIASTLAHDCTLGSDFFQ